MISVLSHPGSTRRFAAARYAAVTGMLIAAVGAMSSSPAADTVDPSQEDNARAFVFMDESALPPVEAHWIDALFEAQERARGFVHLFPMSRYIAGLTTAMRARLARDVETRIRAYNELIDRYPFEKRYYDRLEIVLRQADSPEMYMGEWRRRVAYNPEIAPVAARNLAEMGLVWFAAGNMGNAVTAYETVLNMVGSHVVYAFRLAQLYAFSGEPNRALDVYRELLQQHPALAGVSGTAAQLLRQHMTARDAVVFWKPVFELHPENWIVAMNYAAALEGTEHYNTAAPVYATITRHHPEQKDSLLAYCRCLRLAGRLDGAYQTLKEMGDVDDAIRGLTAYEYIALGQAYAHIAVYESAVACFEHAIGLGEHKAMAYFNLGETLIASGNEFAALAALREATNLAPDNPWFLQRLAVLEEIMEDYEAAIQSYIQVLRLTPGDREVAGRLDHLLLRYNTPDERDAVWHTLGVERSDIANGEGE